MNLLQDLIICSESGRISCLPLCKKILWTKCGSLFATEIHMNVLSCRPPANDLNAVVRLTNKTNKKAQKDGKAAWKLPQEACRERWIQDLAGMKYVLALGPLAASALRRGNASIEALR
ncbi:MAG: hypothetical protein EBU08_06900, partial [Micrococcales bacterium]|nr:hypothetical protein [Micrococcales bacterium]